MPTTLPARSNIGPPELPVFIAASVWMYSSYGPVWRSRLRPETMPAATLFTRPNGLPTVSTQSPIRTSSERPQVTARSGLRGSTLSNAKSMRASRPITRAGRFVPSCKVTRMRVASPTTWSLVTISPAGSTMKPEPSAMVSRRALRPVGARLRRWRSSRSRNSSSSTTSGGSGSGSRALSAGVGSWTEETLTTVGSRRSTKSPKPGAGVGDTGGARRGSAAGAAPCPTSGKSATAAAIESVRSLRSRAMARPPATAIREKILINNATLLRAVPSVHPFGKSGALGIARQQSLELDDVFLRVGDVVAREIGLVDLRLDVLGAPARRGLGRDLAAAHALDLDVGLLGARVLLLVADRLAELGEQVLEALLLDRQGSLLARQQGLATLQLEQQLGAVFVPVGEL